MALRIGLEPPMRTSKAGKRLSERVNALAAELGPFPNARLNFETTGADGKEKRVADQPKKQENRQLRAACPVCGFPIRTSAKWFRVGMPCCPVDQVPMVLEEPLPKEQGEDREERGREEEALAESSEES